MIGPEDRTATARAFIAKAVWNLPTTRDLLDRLRFDKVVRCLCDWHHPSEIPSEATFSRAFAEFAADGLAERMHEALAGAACAEALVGHISRDSTAIVGRERPKAKPKEEEQPKRKRRRRRPRKGEEVVREPTRLQRQRDGGMTLAEMFDESSTGCDVGVRRNAKGYTESWIGFRLHVDCADGDIPTHRASDGRLHCGIETCILLVGVLPHECSNVDDPPCAGLWITPILPNGTESTVQKERNATGKPDLS